MNFYSQFGEDRWIVENLTAELPLPSGTFCEVGAHDGISCSNTLYFEGLGWSGILVEADPFLAAQCWRNRPRAVTWCCAAGQDRCDTFHINLMDRGASGLKAEGLPMQVIVKPLDWLMFHKPVDLLSIDTEGTELEVWESIGGLRPGIVIMEYRTFENPPQDRAIVERMAQDGYRERFRTHCNLILTL